MALHTGEAYTDQEISIRCPDPTAIRQTSQAADVAGSVVHWLTAAEARPDIYYFSVYCRDALVGQILLHDIDRERQTSLIGYHLFEPHHRGRGIGTRPLKLLVHFVVEETNLTTLIIITSRENLASQRVAEKCGFSFAGAPREDPVSGVLFAWKKPS